MNNIEENINKIIKSLPSNVKLVAVSKTHPEDYILKAYNCGQRIFGENKAQEMKRKYENLPKDIEWHFIGHLQTNKIKYIAPYVSLIHAIDSLKLLIEINKEAKKNNRIISCLLQFHVAQEETKWGFSEEEVIELLESNEFKELNNVSIAGVMGMATYTDNETQIRKEFAQIKNIYDSLKSNYFSTNNAFREISMGMSSDYKIAIEQGSTMVRIGTTIFGGR